MNRGWTEVVSGNDADMEKSANLEAKAQLYRKITLDNWKKEPAPASSFVALYMRDVLKRTDDFVAFADTSDKGLDMGIQLTEEVFVLGWLPLGD